MIFTGVLRKIDELGRIVIPKEIRKMLNIRNGDTLKLYVNNNQIIITKVTDNPSFNDYVKKLCDDIVQSFKIDLIVTDRDKIIYCNNEIFNNLNLKLEQEKILNERLDYIIEKNNNHFYLKPIILDSNVIGIICIRIINNSDEIQKIANYLNNVIIKKMDIS